MGIKLIWTKPALIDLSAIAQYIARDSKSYSSDFVYNIRIRGDRLKEFPNQGRIIPEFQNPEYRELIYGNYRMFYTVKNEVAYIITIVHGAQSIDQETLRINF